MIGMHRSGTSAVAGGLEAAGVEFGTSLMTASADNPKGFFEDTRFVALNERLIAWDLQAWDTVAPVQPEAHLSRDRRFDQEAGEIVRSLALGGASAIGLKDPRASLLVPFWTDVFRENGVAPTAVVCLRHPAQVAKSLYDRNRFSRAKSFALWLKYNLSLLTGLAQCELLDGATLLIFEDLCADRDLRAKHAKTLLDDRALDAEAFVDFFDDGLTSPRVSLEPQNAIEELAVSIHQSLCGHGIPAAARIEDWLALWRGLEPMLSLVDLQYQHFAQFSADEKRWLRELEATVQAKDDELARLDAYTRELLAALEAQRADAEKVRVYQRDLETTIRDSQKQQAGVRRELALALSRAKTYHQSASELEEVLSNRAEELAQRDHAIEKLQNETRELQDQSRALQHEMEKLYSSTSWRVSYPIRALRRVIGRLRPGDVTD